MADNGIPKEAQPVKWPDDYPRLLIDMLEYYMEEFGMSREEAWEEFQDRLLFDGVLVQEYAANAKKAKQDTGGKPD